MVTAQSVSEQLDRLHFNPGAWGRQEVRELEHILLPDEQIYELVNGIYEGGFALLVATNIRLLLIDKKPLNFLTVEDLRFDMINEIDYSHRMFGARINISAGAKNLIFRSYNQPRLRKAISHVQSCMAEAKQRQDNHQLGQSQHLERINQQLQAYLLAQHQQQEDLRRQLDQARQSGDVEAVQPAPEIKPAPELADYLYAQSLLREHDLSPQSAPETNPNPPAAELYQDGVQEIFGKRSEQSTTPAPRAKPLEVNPLTIAYSKLPIAMRNRRFQGRKFQPKPAA